VWHLGTGDGAGGEAFGKLRLNSRIDGISQSRPRRVTGPVEVLSMFCTREPAQRPRYLRSGLMLGSVLGRLMACSPFCWRAFPHQWQPPSVLSHLCNRLSVPAHHLRAPQCCWVHRPSCMRSFEGPSPSSPTSFDRTPSPDDSTRVSQPPVYHVAARRTTLANLIRVESRSSHGDQYCFPTSVPSCAHEEALGDPSGHPLERPSSHPATRGSFVASFGDVFVRREAI